MKKVKTIQQHGTEYTIQQMGNCSYRIDYKAARETRTHHVEKVWASVEEAEEYIATCKSMDAVGEMASDKYMAQKRYSEKHIKRVPLDLNHRTDQDIIDYLSTVDNVQGYIKAMIRKDMEEKSQK